MIWIVGVKGLGKTTLAMKVFDSIIVTHHFELHIWVTISQEFELHIWVTILQNLMKKIPVRHLTRTTQCSMATPLVLPEELLHVFSSVSCLIVLYGLWTCEALEALGEAKISAVGMTRIMIRTRCSELADPVKRRNHIIHDMRKLSDQEAWELFNVKVHVPKQLKKLGLELVRKCMGFPLDIVSVGDILLRRAVTEEQWLNQVFNQNQISVFNELEAAVDSFPSHLKDCLSSFGLFNDDLDIPIKRLIAYGVAEGHVQEEGGSKDPPEILA